MMLMCKNTPVYDIENEKTLNYNLLPGLMQQKGADNHTFTKWMKYRYSSGTNTIARKLKGITFGQGARMRINRETRALSFIDCYWTEFKLVLLGELHIEIRITCITNHYGTETKNLRDRRHRNSTWVVHCQRNGNRTESSTNMAIFPWNCNVLSFAGNAEFL